MDAQRPFAYRIRVKGHLDRHWSQWFDGLTVTLAAQGETHLTGEVRDQAALHGILTKLRDLGLPLIALQRIELSEASDGQVHQGE